MKYFWLDTPIGHIYLLDINISYTYSRDKLKAEPPNIATNSHNSNTAGLEK